MVAPAVLLQWTYAAIAVTSVGLGVYLLANRDRQATVPLAVTTFGLAVWSLGALGEIPAGRFWYSQFHRLLHLGTLVTVFGAFVFALEYTGRERYITRQTLGALAAYGVVAFTVLVVNPGQLFFGDLTAVETIRGFEYGWAPLLAGHSVVLYAFIAAVLFMMVEFVLRSRQWLYRGQVAALLLGTFVPVVLNLLYLTGTVELRVTPIGFAASVLLFTFAVVNYRLGDVTPIAREKVLDTVRDGVLVVDTDGRITDSNPAAHRLLGVDRPPVGRSVSDVLGAIPELLDAYEDLTDGGGETVQTVTYGGRFVAVRATPIEDDSGRHVGWTLLLQDVSEQVRRERDLEEQVEKLDQFASIVSHDLRNPINVARGYVTQTQATGDLDHLDKSLEAIDRMEDIVDDVLALTRGGEVTEPAPVSLASLARDTWAGIDTGAATLEVPTDQTIVADADRLRRLLENLFRNSIEHGVEPREDSDAFGEGHTITVDVHEGEGSDVTVSVADNGVGIPQERRDQVFEDGYTTGGTGLGLTIVEEIASAHGWEVSLTESPEGGAAFELHGVGTPVRAPQ